MAEKQSGTLKKVLLRVKKYWPVLILSLILDDSASALDYATDANLRRAVRNMENPPTTFIVSQRAASVRYADQILVLDDGRLVGRGKHDELLANCPVYQEVYYSQFPREVKDNG